MTRLLADRLIPGKLQGNHAGIAEPARTLAPEWVYGDPHRARLPRVGMPHPAWMCVGQSDQGPSVHQRDLWSSMEFMRPTTGAS